LVKLWELESKQDINKEFQNLQTERFTSINEVTENYTGKNNYVEKDKNYLDVDFGEGDRNLHS